MQALGWQRAGASQVVRLGLLNTDSLDPMSFSSGGLSLARRQLLRFHSLSTLWSRFVGMLDGSGAPVAPGPFAKLKEQLDLVGWSLDAHLTL